MVFRKKTDNMLKARIRDSSLAFKSIRLVIFMMMFVLVVVMFVGGVLGQVYAVEEPPGSGNVVGITTEFVEGQKEASEADMQRFMKDFTSWSNEQQNKATEIQKKAAYKEKTGVDFNGDISKTTVNSDGKVFQDGKEVASNTDGLKSMEFSGNDVEFNTDKGGTTTLSMDGTYSGPQGGGKATPGTGCAIASITGFATCGGGGGGGGQAGKALDERFQAFLSAWGQISGILKEIQAAVKPEGDAGMEPTGPPTNGVQVTLGNGGETSLWNVESEKAVDLAQENPEGGDSVTEITKDLTEMIASDNTKVNSPGEIVTHVPEGTPDTYVANQGTGGDPFSQDFVSPISEVDDSSTGGILTAVSVPLAIKAGAAPITGHAIIDSNQYVKLIVQDLGVGGQNLVVDMFKSLRLVDGSGTNLLIRNGNSRVLFYGQQTLYPRRIIETPHNMHKITNSQDPNNFFRLRNEERGERNYLIDGKKVVSFGNKVVNHPKIKGLKIAQVREDMWQE